MHREGVFRNCELHTIPCNVARKPAWIFFTPLHKQNFRFRTAHRCQAPFGLQLHMHNVLKMGISPHNGTSWIPCKGKHQLQRLGRRREAQIRPSVFIGDAFCSSIFFSFRPVCLIGGGACSSSRTSIQPDQWPRRLSSTFSTSLFSTEGFIHPPDWFCHTGSSIRFLYKYDPRVSILVSKELARWVWLIRFIDNLKGYENVNP